MKVQVGSLLGAKTSLKNLLLSSDTLLKGGCLQLVLCNVLSVSRSKGRCFLSEQENLLGRFGSNLVFGTDLDTQDFISLELCHLWILQAAPRLAGERNRWCEVRLIIPRLSRSLVCLCMDFLFAPRHKNLLSCLAKSTGYKIQVSDLLFATSSLEVMGYLRTRLSALNPFGLVPIPSGVFLVLQKECRSSSWRRQSFISNHYPPLPLSLLFAVLLLQTNPTA